MLTDAASTPPPKVRACCGWVDVSILIRLRDTSRFVEELFQYSKVNCGESVGLDRVSKLVHEPEL